MRRFANRGRRLSAEIRDACQDEFEPLPCRKPCVSRSRTVQSWRALAAALAAEEAPALEGSDRQRAQKREQRLAGTVPTTVNVLSGGQLLRAARGSTECQPALGRSRLASSS
jgi:hypothetical protein